MTTKEKLIQEIEQSPEPFLEEFLDFILFAKSRRHHEFYSDVSKPYKPIWEVAAELVRDIPPDVLEKLPNDSAENHDHYLYGSPKKES
ncbi:hypothetical protein ABRG53_0650 [Pseudanabaena sp. ABRG5-3]|nr:hypothetical protein ABRG53_0650 [Pseudanabaena sp. ABRG5-3]